MCCSIYHKIIYPFIVSVDDLKYILRQYKCVNCQTFCHVILGI